jgi:hypothetical protein
MQRKILVLKCHVSICTGVQIGLFDNLLLVLFPISKLHVFLLFFIVTHSPAFFSNAHCQH